MADLGHIKWSATLMDIPIKNIDTICGSALPSRRIDEGIKIVSGLQQRRIFWRRTPAEASN
jgi:hypothetical protein